MQLVHPAKLKFYAALVAAARKAGRQQKDVAAALGLHPSILSRRIQGHGPLEDEPEILQAITTLGLTESTGQLLELWRAAHAGIFGCETAVPASLGPVADTARRHNQLRDEYLLLRPGAELGKELAKFIRVCLDLSASCDQRGRWPQGIQLASQALEVAMNLDAHHLQFSAAHQLALMTRVADAQDGEAAVAQFADLLQLYQQGFPKKLVAEDALARAYRDGARAVARNPDGWALADKMLREATRWANDFARRDRAQLFHTRLDRCALAVLRADREAAELELDAADRIRGAAARERETWLDLRAEAKHGLMGAAVNGLLGNREACHHAAEYWLGHPDADPGYQSRDTARGIAKWAETGFREQLVPVVLLR